MASRWRLFDDAQRIIAGIGYVPTHTKVQSPLRDIKVQVLDSSRLVDEYDRSMRLFDEVVLRPNR